MSNCSVFVIFNWKVGQAHQGLLGMVQRAMAKSTHHIWFERSEAKDRHLVAERSHQFFVNSEDHISNFLCIHFSIYPKSFSIIENFKLK